MERISSAGTRFAKLGVPGVTFTILAAIAAQALRNGQQGTGLPLLFLLGFAFLLLSALFSALLARLADEVIDHGTHLEVRRGRRRTRVDLARITYVGYSTLASPRTVWLSFKPSTEFGREISFIPRGASFGFSVPTVVTELRKRVQSARSCAGAA